MGRSSEFILFFPLALPGRILTIDLKLFLQFEGPTTMLLQSRASRLSDILTLKDVDEIANSPPGAVQDAVARKINEEIKEISESVPKTPTPSAASDGAKVQYATMRHGKAEFEKPS
jgi:hypothetical protein